MDEKMQFVARRLAGESMAELCREFGIARKTGYKIFDRYQMGEGRSPRDALSSQGSTRSWRKEKETGYEKD